MLSLWVVPGWWCSSLGSSIRTELWAWVLLFCAISGKEDPKAHQDILQSDLNLSQPTSQIQTHLIKQNLDTGGKTSPTAQATASAILGAPQISAPKVVKCHRCEFSWHAWLCINVCVCTCMNGEWESARERESMSVCVCVCVCVCVACASVRESVVFSSISKCLPLEPS